MNKYLTDLEYAPFPIWNQFISFLCVALYGIKEAFDSILTSSKAGGRTTYGLGIANATAGEITTGENPNARQLLVWRNVNQYWVATCDYQILQTDMQYIYAYSVPPYLEWGTD